MTLALVALKQAQSQLGVQEVPRGSNAGPAVEKYLKSVGLGKGYAWCMAFLYWCFKEASVQNATTNPLYRTGGVLKMWNEMKHKRVTDPQPGDIGVMDFGGGAGHAFIVEKVLGGGKLQTIEGNTNDEGSREGYEVARRTRNIKQTKGFIRL
jgi:hypothetical protein